VGLILCGVARLLGVAVGVLGCLTACGDDPIPPLQVAAPGIIFTYPIDGQLDVPVAARIVVTFSDPVTMSALGTCTGGGEGAVSGGFCLVGPNGHVDAMPTVSSDGISVEFASTTLDPGTQYQLFVGAALAPDAKNIPASGPLLAFTTRSNQPNSAGPAVIAINGTAPANLANQPMYETTTIRLVFSEPLDPRTVTLATGSVELVDGSGTAVPATVIVKGIHMSIDPTTDLTDGATYQVRLGSQIADLGGRAMTATTFSLTPANSLGAGKIAQVLRTRQTSDPGPAVTRSGSDRNVIAISKPLIGAQTIAVQPGAINAELGDPKALNGPIAFTIRRGQRLSASGLDVKLGGDIDAGLSTGDIFFEFLTDSGGRLYRNPYQPATQAPENDRSPVYVDLTFDVAVFTVDPMGNAVLAQTVLGVQATGTAIATDGVLAIEAVASMEIDLLGVTQAPSNLVLELITDPTASVPVDTTPPTLVASFPADGVRDQPVAAGIELIFSEPIDLDRARAGGITLVNGAGMTIPTIIESHGGAVVVRPLSTLAYSTGFMVMLSDVADVAGNPLSGTTTALSFSTPDLVGSDVPLMVAAIHPGVPCALTGATATSPGRCSGGAGGDDLYQPFTLAANDAVQVAFTQPPTPATITLGTACNAGSVRVEELDATGACVDAVPGTLEMRNRGFAFVPDVPWTVGTSYRVSLISGNNKSCDPGELCGISGDAASFDPLSGTTNGDSGGPGLIVMFTATDASPGVAMLAEAAPYSDVNGSGFLDGSELTSDGNRAALKITGTTGAVGSASFTSSPCPTGGAGEACMYLLGTMPVSIGELQNNCSLPDGSSAASCMPVTIATEAMYATSVTMKASVGISITTDTGTTVMRIREPAGGGPVMGYIINGGSGPTMVVSLNLYMDAPDMSIPLSSHDLHSKPLTIALSGPVTFLPDGRINIQLANTADVPVEINISAPLGISGAVQLSVPMGEMHLQLVSPPLRGVEL
jgi:Bacterial Ig-like domain